jgi:hypothetical protein
MFQYYWLSYFALVKVSLHGAYLSKELFLGQFKDNEMLGNGDNKENCMMQ